MLAIVFAIDGDHVWCRRATIYRARRKFLALYPPSNSKSCGGLRCAMPAKREDVETLVAAVPGFRPSWEKFLGEYAGEDATPYYIAMSELAHYVVENYAKGTTAEFPNLFSTVESLFQKKDDDLESLLTVGLLEDIQNIASHRDFGFAVFRRRLGPRSLLVWDEIEAFMRRVALWERRQGPRWWQFWRRRKAFDSERALGKVESPELRKIIESLYRKDL